MTEFLLFYVITGLLFAIIAANMGLKFIHQVLIVLLWGPTLVVSALFGKRLEKWRP